MISNIKKAIKGYRQKREMKRLKPILKNILVNEGFMNAVTYAAYNGEKFLGGLGLSRDFSIVDLPTLRRFSVQFWRSNPIAVSIFNRLSTNVINDGLKLEAVPTDKLLTSLFNLTDEQLNEWAETIEMLFDLYAFQAETVDIRKKFNLHEIALQTYDTAKISGDCLVINRPRPDNFPYVQIIDGMDIASPMDVISNLGVNPKSGNMVIEGVEIDANGVEIGFHIRARAIDPGRFTSSMDFKFIPAYNPNTGRRVANMVYGSRLRVNEYRGVPLLGHVLQSLNQIDKAMDSEQLAMLLDSLLVLSVTKDANAPESMKDLLSDDDSSGFKSASVNKTNILTDGSTGFDTVPINEYLPGVMINNLPRGVKVESHNSRRPNVNVFQAVLHGIDIISASIGVPPEITLLKFNNNFSAARQAAIEFNALVNMEAFKFSCQFYDPIYKDFLFAGFLNNMIQMPGYLEAYQSNQKWVTGAWESAVWRGISKPSIDELKQMKTFIEAVNNGFRSRTDIVSVMMGGSYDKTIKRLARDNQKLADALRPLEQIRQGVFNEDNSDGDNNSDGSNIRKELKMIQSQLKRIGIEIPESIADAVESAQLIDNVNQGADR